MKLQGVRKCANFLGHPVRSDCRQYGSFAVDLRFPAVLCGYKTAQKHSLNRINGKIV